MISSKAEVELKKISDLALKKGAVNEEDIYYPCAGFVYCPVIVFLQRILSGT